MRKIKKTNKNIQQLELKLQVNNPGCTSKRLSKKPAKSKVTKKIYGHKLSGMLSDSLITVEELAVIFKVAP